MSVVNPFLLNLAGSNSYEAIFATDMAPTVDIVNTKVGFGSMAFNANNSHYAQITNFSVPTTGLTIACWFKISSVGNSRVFDFGNGQGSDNIAYSPNTGTLYYMGTTAFNVNSASGTADNTWHHFVWTMTFSPPYSNSSVHTVYLDNVVVYTSTTEYYPSVGPRTNCYLGKSNWSSDSYTTGNIDDFRIYNTALTASDVQTLYYTISNSTNGFMSYYLANYYPFETSNFEWITNGYFTTSVTYGWNIEPYGWKSYAGPLGTDLSGNIGIANTTSWTTYNILTNLTHGMEPLPQGVTNFVWLFLYGAPKPGIYQDISFSSVGNYTLSFWVSAYNFANGDVTSPLYIITGSTTNTIIFHSTNIFGVNWKKYSFNFTVNSINSATRIVLYTDNPSYLFYLSGISVVYASSTTSTNTLLGSSVGNLASGNLVYDATMNNGASIIYNDYKVGKSCLALNASIANQYVQINNFSVTNKGLTIACWFKYTSTGWSRLFDFGNGISSDNIIYSPYNGTLLYIGSIDNQVFAGSGKADGNWHHFVWTMTYASSGSATCIHTIYIDNVPTVITGKYYPTLGVRTNCYIGKSNWNDPYATGYVDDFRVYNGVLLANDVNTLYNSTLNITFSGNYNLGLANTTAVTVYDASLNGGAYVSKTNYIKGKSNLAMDTSGQYVTFNNRLITGDALSFSFWMRGNNGCGQYTLFDYNNGPGGKNKITMGLQNNTLYSQVINGKGLGTINFVNYTTAFTPGSGTISALCATSDGTRITYCDQTAVNNINTYIYANSAWYLSGSITISSSNTPVGLCCTADGSRLVISCRARTGSILYATWNGTAYVGATATGFGQSTSEGVSMTPDGSILVVASGSGTSNNYVYFSYWDKTAKNYTTFKSFSTSGRWFGVDITTDGKMVAYTDNVSNTAYYSVWNNATQTYDTQTAITTLNTGVYRIAFSKDGNLLFIGISNANSSTGFQYAVWNGTSFSSLTSFPSGVVPVNFLNTGMVVGWDNTVYISAYGNTYTSILKFKYNVMNQYSVSNFYNDQNLNDNNWRHIAWTIDSKNKTYKYYLNGSLIKIDTSSNYAFPEQTTRSNNLLGVSTDLSLSYFTGGIGDYQVYSTVLSDSQVSDIYSGKLFGSSSAVSEIKNVFKPYSSGIKSDLDVKLLGNYTEEIFQPYTSGTKANPTGIYASRFGVLTDICNLYQPVQNSFVFTYTGSDQTFIIPPRTNVVIIECWGAGGGTQGGGSTACIHKGNGGGGGYTKAFFSINSGTTLTVIVGQGGQTSNNGQSLVSTYGGGGGQLGQVNYGSASGGGRSAVQITTGTVEIVTAGGGGGGGLIQSNVVTALPAGNGGGGGGMTGGNALSLFSDEGGKGGTNTAGGAVATSNSIGTVGSSGTKYTGGGGSTYGAGGGGGYYGGGAGGVYQVVSSGLSFGGGGGGSSYINTGYLYSGISSKSMIQGISPTVANASGIPTAYTNSVGNGGVASNFNGINTGGSAGQNGLVIITCQ